LDLRFPIEERALASEIVNPKSEVEYANEVSPMTFLKTRYKLKKELIPKDFEHISRLSTVYGIRGLAFEGQDLIVEYDASRIHEAELLARVRGTGIPVDPSQSIPLGGFDHTGEFHDFAWPTQGLSPANQKAK
jgi:hypothetical protein